MLDTRANHGERREQVGLCLPFPTIPVVGRGANFYWFDLWRFAIACTVWGDLFNRPVCGVV